MKSTQKKHKRNLKRRKKSAVPEKQYPFWQSFLRCFFTTLLIAGGLLLFTSFAVSLLEDPAAFVKPCSLAALFLSIFFGGLLASEFYTSKVLGTILNTLCFIALMLLLSLFFRKVTPQFNAVSTAILFAALLPVSLLGCFLGKKKAKA